MKQQYDAILYVDNIENINEDNRTNPRSGQVGVDSGPGIYIDVDDPRMYSAFNFGKAVQNDLNNIGRGYFGEVTDFGKWVVATVGYHSVITGKTATKTFLIVFKKESDGIILSSNARWRSISGYSQATSYIKSVCSSLEAEANRR